MFVDPTGAFSFLSRVRWFTCFRTSGHLHQWSRFSTHWNIIGTSLNNPTWPRPFSSLTCSAAMHIGAVMGCLNR